jgi:PAS domain S-box-containing protein
LHWDAENHMELALSVMDITESKRAHNTIACLNLALEKKVAEQTHTLTNTNWDLIQKIEQLKTARRQLHEREAVLQSMFNHVSEAIITTTSEGLMIDVNQAAERLFGYSRQQLLNQPISQLLPCGLVCVDNASASLAGCNKDDAISTIYGRSSTGEPLPLDVSFTSFTVELQRYTTTIIRDGRPRLEQEAREQAHLDELAHVTRLSLMGELASGIAHELNQPLTGVVNYSEVALSISQQPTVATDALQTLLKKINEQALKAGQIIHRMREFLQNRAVRQQAIVINDLIMTALDLCEPMIKQADVSLDLVLDGHLPVCCGDSIQIEQVIINLIRNSIDAFAELSADRKRLLSIQTRVTPDGAVQVRIKDNGIGIPEQAVKQIFSPFYTSKDHGMGMGLSICRSIIQAHGGVLRFNSLPDKGTTFYFTLPIRN